MSLHVWLAIVISACFVIVTSNAISVGIEERIVGGSEAHVVNFPYQVSIRRKSCATCAYEQFASGAIYTKNVIITSANALRSESGKTLMVVAGTSHRTSSDGMLFPVDEIIIHKDFHPLTLDYDIAILMLKVDLPLGGSPTVKALNIPDDVPAVGTIGIIAGWGQTTEIGDYSETIQNTRVPIVSSESCQSSYQFSTITENMLCAGIAAGGSDACKGDGGSPLVVANEFIGLASWGVGCARPNNPGVYTNLVQLRAWIDITIMEI